MGRTIGGHVLVARPDRAALTDDVDVVWDGPTIQGLVARGGGPGNPGAGTDVLDATGAYVLPGIVDLHGDAFERCIMPRAGVSLDLELALLDNDAQLAASGITTSFLSATDSWEPGLRSRATLRSLIDALGVTTDRGIETRLHVRHERCNTDALDELVGWVETGTIGLLSFNDHAPKGRSPGQLARNGRLSPAQVDRSGVDHHELQRRCSHAVTQRDLGRRQEEILAAAAQAAGLRTASHDAEWIDNLADDLLLGVSIAEFPLSIGLAHRYRHEGIEVLLGAPNLVRGRSHLGNLSALEAWRSGVEALLCSDYHYPSLLQAPFVLRRKLGLDLARTWDAVSRRPAVAVGLHDRGLLEVGRRADLLVVEPPVGERPARLRATVSAGRVVHHRARVPATSCTS